MDWKNKTLLITAIAGLGIGLLAGMLYIRSVEDSGGKPPDKPDTGTLVTIGLAALGLVRQVAALGQPEES